MQTELSLSQKRVCNELSRLKGEELEDNSTAEEEHPTLFIQVTNSVCERGCGRLEYKRQRDELSCCVSM